MEYAYPVVAGQEIYLWPRPNRTHGYYYPLWDSPWYLDYWWGGDFYGPPGVVIEEDADRDDGGGDHDRR